MVFFKKIQKQKAIAPGLRFCPECDAKLGSAIIFAKTTIGF
jgi:uncharacterized protein (UPF0212 family)